MAPGTLQERHTPSNPEARDGTGGVPASEVQLSLVWLLELLFDNRRTLVTVPLLLAGLLAIFWVFDDPEYEATSRFLTEESRQPTGLSGAAQLFATFTGGGAGEPLMFYPELITSMEILKEAAAEEYRVATGDGERDTVTVTLATVYEVDPEADRDETLKAVAENLAGDVEVVINSGARMVELNTVAGRPELAVQINRTLLDLVHAWNIERRQSQARAEREFLEARVEETQRELQAAETEMQRFLEQNRRYEQSPELRFELGRLERRVNLIQQRYVAMAQAYDQARAEEVRQTPLISVVDEPADTVHRITSSLVLRVLFGLVAGFLLALMFVLGREYVRFEKRQQPRRWDRLRERVADTWRPMDLLLRRRGGRRTDA